MSFQIVWLITMMVKKISDGLNFLSILLTGNQRMHLNTNKIAFKSFYTSHIYLVGNKIKCSQKRNEGEIN